MSSVVFAIPLDEVHQAVREALVIFADRLRRSLVIGEDALAKFLRQGLQGIVDGVLVDVGEQFLDGLTVGEVVGGRGGGLICRDQCEKADQREEDLKNVDAQHGGCGC